MQPCQRRTIGGTEGKRWTGDPRHPPLLHPPLSLLGSPSHPIPCVRRDCTARGRYWGAYGSAQGDAPVRLSLPLSLYLSIYLFQSTLARDYVRTHTHARAHILSLSLSPLRWSSVSVRRVGTSGASMIPSRSVDSACPPLALYNAAPTVRYSVRLRSSGEEGNGLWAEGDPRNLAKLARRNYRYWATTYRHGISSSHPLFDLDATEARRESAGFHTWMITTLLAAPLYA